MAPFMTIIGVEYVLQEVRNGVVEVGLEGQGNGLASDFSLFSFDIFLKTVGEILL